MDGGSSINILYYETFRRMSLTHKQLQPWDTVSHGIIPGKSARPIGKICLEVAFGSAANFRSEVIPFEVIKLRSTYYAILGRPAYARFMARPFYVFLKLKMPGPNGTITVEGNRAIAMACEQDDVAYVETACVKEDLSTYQERVDLADPTVLKKPTQDSAPKFEPTQDMKKMDFVPGDSTKQFTIGTRLSDK